MNLDELEEQIIHLKRLVENFPVRLAAAGGGGSGSKGVIFGKLTEDLNCNSSALFTSAMGKTYEVWEVQGPAAAGSTEYGIVWSTDNKYKRPVWGLVFEPCNHCPPDVFNCVGQTCDYAWDGIQWGPNPVRNCDDTLHCSCPPPTLIPGPGGFVGQIYTLNCGGGAS